MTENIYIPEHKWGCVCQRVHSPSSSFLPSAPCVTLSFTLAANHQWMAVLNVSESAAGDNQYQNMKTTFHNQCVA